jgi:hypothetical protein
MTLTAQRAAAVLAAVSICVLAACTSSDNVSSSGPTGGLQVPDQPYGPFPYVSEVQRRSFHAFLECAARAGVDFEGPYADSSGEGALIKLAPGQDEMSFQDRARVAHRCPEGAVAFAVTPGAPKHAFVRALDRFAHCLTDHGLDGLPMPVYGSPDPYQGLQWPIDWSDRATVAAARQCAEPLREFTLGS